MRTIADSHSSFITTIEISPISPIIITGSVDKTLAIWNCS